MNIWKDVFWFYSIVFVILVVTIPFSGHVSLGALVVLLASGITLIPLYGYSHQLPIGSKAIASIIFFYNAVLVLACLIACVYALITHWGLASILLSLLAMLYLFVFLYPQYRYAMKSDDLWRVADRQASAGN